MDSVQKPGSQLIRQNTGTSQRPMINKPVNTDENISLEKNQIIRGLVTDLRPGEISIRLANKQAVAAHLEGNNEVSIGDVASFKIIENTDGEITLFKLNSIISPEESTILKALEEANLPANTVNIEIVRELLYNQLPINKESINMILKQAMQYKDAQISTLVYMNKNGLPLEEGFLKNFEQLRNFDYRLYNHIQSAKDEFLQFMAQVASNESESTLLSFTRQMFELLNIKDTANSLPVDAMSSDTALTVPVSEAPVDAQDFSQIHTGNSDSNLHLTSKEQSQLLQLFSSYDLPEEFMHSIENNTIDLREMVHHISEALTKAVNTNPAQIEDFKTPLILTIMEQYGNFQQSHNEIASFLSTNQRMELLDAIQDFPLNISDAASIANGEISSSQLLHLISGFTGPEYTKSFRKLFTSEPFIKLISHQMNGELSLTTEDLKESNGVDKYYTNILEKMDKLKSLTALDTIKTNPAMFQDKAEGVKQSFDFMKTFNQLFTYVQLPVKLTNQITHGDLYVYTNKEKLKAGADKISVLLHLDMDHLGPIDIHLSLSSSTVQGKFYVSDKDSKTLLSKHEEALRSSLSKIGYHLNMEIYQRTKEVDILKDLREEQPSATQIKRYSFDIRA